MIPYPRSRRRGAVTVEAAVVYPVMFLLLLGIVVGGYGVFRYQSVAGLAREAARRASTQGQNYARELGRTPPTEEQIRALVLERAVSLDPAKLTVRVHWVNGIDGQAVEWDRCDKRPKSTTEDAEPVTNRVRVTVDYQWVPELFLVGPINLKSTSEIPMSY
jgi:Flp pilus assembly protein TadG